MHVMVIVKNGQPQFPAQCQHACREAEQQRRDDNHILIADIVLQRDIQHGGGKGNARVELFLKDERNAFAEHVAQDAAKHTGNDGGNGGNDRTFAHLQRDLRPDNGKDDQAKRIEDQEQAAKMGHHGGHQRGQHRCNGHDNDIFRVFHPAQRIVPKQHIPDRSAAQRRSGCDDDDAKGIHTAASGSQRAGHGFGSNTNQIKNV